MNVRIYETKTGTFFTILGLLLALSSLLYGIYSSNASTDLSKQQHKELMDEEQRQTELLENIYNTLDSILNNNIHL